MIEKKIFAVYGRFEFVCEPVWLKAFCEKHNYQYEYHVTLKQSCFIREEQFYEIKDTIHRVLHDFKLPSAHIDLELEGLRYDEPDGCIMLMAKENQDLNALQRNLVSALSKFGEYVSPELESYEKNFEPHITIALELGDRTAQVASTIPQDVSSFGVINEIVLSCVSNITPQEANALANNTRFRLAPHKARP